MVVYYFGQAFVELSLAALHNFLVAVVWLGKELGLIRALVCWLFFEGGITIVRLLFQPPSLARGW